MAVLGLIHTERHPQSVVPSYAISLRIHCENENASTDMGSGAISLCSCYAMPGSDIAIAPPRHALWT